MGGEWADHPFKLIATPRITHNDPTNSSPSLRIATEMALAHNSFFRALNSIYLQCCGVSKPQDIADFLIYAQSWFEMVSHHHDTEEELFFPAIAKYSGDEGVMRGNIEGHRAFHGGLEAFGKFVRESTPETYGGAALKSIIDSFAAPIQAHMEEEIESLISVGEKYGGEDLVKAYDAMEARILATSDKYRLFPLVMGSRDVTYEGGVHHWPPIPFFVPYIVHYYFERRHAGAWRFSPSDTYGKPRELKFLPK